MNAKVDKALEKRTVNNEPETNAQITEDSTNEKLNMLILWFGAFLMTTINFSRKKYRDFACDIDEGVRIFTKRTMV